MADSTKSSKIFNDFILPIALKFSKPSDPRDSVGQ